MKQNNKYRNMALEILIGLTVVNLLFLWYLENIGMAVVVQFVLLYVFDFLFRKNLFGKKRKVRWNIASGILKGMGILLSIYVSLILGLMMTLFVIISTRLMFHEDKDRTVETVEELKEAYFVPVIIKVLTKMKDTRFVRILLDGFYEFRLRAVYVLSE